MRVIENGGTAVDTALSDLPRALVELIGRIPAPERALMEPFFGAAARAIRDLRDINITQYEAQEFNPHDLSIWESVAPVVGQTIVTVNALLTFIRDRFPDGAESGADNSDDAFDEMLEDTGKVRAQAIVKDAEARSKEAIAIIKAIAQTLSREIIAFGDSMRSPSMMANKWNLLDRLGAVRGKFRAGISEMLFLAASAFEAVEKRQVVPGYAEEIEESVTVRTVVFGLARAVRAELSLLLETDIDLQAASAIAGGVQGAIKGFIDHRAFAWLRTSDKREFLKAHEELAALGQHPPSSVKRFREIADGFDKFLESLALINRRETLQLHDRELLRTLPDYLNMVDVADLEAARAVIAECIRMASRLFGMSGTFDEQLARLEKLQVATLNAQALEREVSQLRTVVAEALAERTQTRI